MSRFLLWASATGPLVFVAAVLVGGARRVGYDHWRDPVSALTEAGANGSPLVGGLFVVAALLGALFAAALLGRRDRALALPGLMLVANAGLAVLLATILPQDPVGAKLTVTGALHIGLVAASAFLIIAAILMLGARLPRQARLSPGFTAYSRATVAMMLVGGLIVPVVAATGLPLLGLAERITQLAYLQWFVVTPVLLAGKAAAR